MPASLFRLYVMAYQNGFIQNKTNGTGSHERYTPRRYVEMVRTVLGTIDLDPASCKTAHRTTQAKRYYTVEDNGLLLPWHGNVFLNPPFSITGRFVDKFVSEIYARRVRQAIFLTNTANNARWFHDLLVCRTPFALHAPMLGSLIRMAIHAHWFKANALPTSEKM